MQVAAKLTAFVWPGSGIAIQHQPLAGGPTPHASPHGRVLHHPAGRRLYVSVCGDVAYGEKGEG